MSDQGGMLRGAKREAERDETVVGQCRHCGERTPVEL